MRAVLILVLALGGPAALFFLWAWAVAIKRERKLKGTLPAWQDLPWTNLLITGLLLAVAAVLSLYFIDDRKGGLLGMNVPSSGGGEVSHLAFASSRAQRGISCGRRTMYHSQEIPRCARDDSGHPPGEG